MIQTVFILSMDMGEVMFEKHWMGKPVGRAICDWFWDEVQQAGSHKEVPSVLVSPTYYVMHIQRNGVTFLACTQSEMPPLLGIEFLNRVADMLTEYLGALNEDCLKDNFITVYQVLEEMMDGGFPLTTEPNMLREIIAPPNMMMRMMSAVTGGGFAGMLAGAAPPPAPPVSNGAVPWRSDGVRHVLNEILIDIAEQMDATVSRDGQLLRCEVYGEILTTSRLSGTPDLTLTFANTGILHDVRFHPCVRVRAWDVTRAICFVPPDGFFKLMSYRVKHLRGTPIYVKPQVSYSGGVGRVSVLVGMRNEGLTVDNISLKMHFPSSTLSTDLTANHGQVSFDHHDKLCTWVVGRVPSDKAPCMTGTIQLEPGVESSEESLTILVGFKAMGVALSGLTIEGIGLQNENYKPSKGCRAHTTAGCFQVRT